jgi:hypothetical protein
MARPRRPIHEIERNLLHDMYRRHGALWDIVLNDVRRGPRFQQLAENMCENFTKMLVNEMQCEDGLWNLKLESNEGTFNMHLHVSYVSTRHIHS